MKKFQEIEFEGECLDLSFDGKGLVKYDGQIGWIPNLLPGEKARIVITYRTSNQFHGYVKELITKSKDRVKPICPVFSSCGGCSLQHISYEAQKRYKHDKVYDCLTRIGGIKDVEVNDTVGMDEPYFYRNKIQMPLGLDKKKHVISGFYREKSHEIIPIEQCYIENDDADRILKTIRSLIEEFHYLPYDEDKRKGIFRHVLIRTAYHYDGIMVVLVTNVDEFKGKNNFVKELVKREPKITTVVQNVNTRDTNVILGDKERVLYGKGFIVDTILGVSFKISAKSFYQVNPIQVEKLYSLAIDCAGLSGKERVLDAYCGVGTIGLVASKKAKEVIGVEIVPEAVKDAVNNAKANKIENAKFFEGDAGEFIMTQFNNGINFDVVIMDPPRKGSDEKFLQTLINANVKKVVYVSCDPATLARDLKYLSPYYKIESVTPVDMFPNTFHIETVVSLTLKNQK
jgi:23S rRNA (uracil1939-C5)-methyltransferase